MNRGGGGRGPFFLFPSPRGSCFALALKNEEKQVRRSFEDDQRRIKQLSALWVDFVENVDLKSFPELLECNYSRFLGYIKP